MFVGRERELTQLGTLFQKKTASLVVCQGRRRIGKSTLIRQFGKSVTNYLEFQGLAPGPNIGKSDQLNAFSTQLANQTGLPKLKFEDWDQAFSLLAKSISNKKTVVLFDEISWMAIGSPTFSSLLKAAWDMEFKSHSGLVFVLCGSSSSWIDKNVLSHTGYVGRVSLEILLDELPLPYCNLFWGKNRDRISYFEKLKVLSVTGGVPRYLEEIHPNKSAEENIRNLCFNKTGLLFNEFSHIFSDIFDKRAVVYKKIVFALSKSPQSVSDVCQLLNIAKGGSTVIYLDDLIRSGFVAKDVVFNPKSGKNTKQIKYRIKDNYLRFYLKYIEPCSANIEKGIYGNTGISNIIQWDSILGLQFETLVLNNPLQICRCLNINPESIVSFSPYYKKPLRNSKGVQIDLLIHTKNAIYPCEIKFRKRIDRKVIDESKEKISRVPVNSLSSIRPVLIYAGELDKAIKSSDYFDRYASFEDLLLN